MVSWTSEDVSDELRARWRALSVEEIRNHKEEAAEKIQEVMQDLYMETGIDFQIECKIVANNELNRLTQWVGRYRYLVRLIGHV